ncbi:hypothetical protein BC830DRAFT_1157881 [Chytriomyces sp. MP71]|nr:hypothetical protein BC830DRAFT_1157881 [Chytriomyces sp. MP71]
MESYKPNNFSYFSYGFGLASLILFCCTWLDDLKKLKLACDVVFGFGIFLDIVDAIMMFMGGKKKEDIPEATSVVILEQQGGSSFSHTMYQPINQNTKQYGP